MPNPRLRVRTGCRTCKIRKVKCDESRPVCGKCLRGRHTCGGYEVRAHPRVAGTAHVLIQACPQGIYSSWNMTSREMRAFENYRRLEVHLLPSVEVTPSTALASPYWGVTILRSCHRYVSLRHAVMAFGEAFGSMSAEQAKRSIRGDLRTREVTRHISLAIQHLSTTNDVLEAIQGSTVLGAVAMGLNDIPECMGHILNGIKLALTLPSRMADQIPSTYRQFKSLGRLLGTQLQPRSDNDCCSRVKVAGPAFQSWSWWVKVATSIETALSDEAIQVLDDVFDFILDVEDALQRGEGLCADIKTRSQELQLKLDAWFADMQVQNLQPCTHKARVCMSRINLICLIHSIALQACLQSTPYAPLETCERFSAMLRTAAGLGDECEGPELVPLVFMLGFLKAPTYQVRLHFPKLVWQHTYDHFEENPSWGGAAE